MKEAFDMVKSRIAESKEKQKFDYDSKHIDIKFNVEDWVALLKRTGKIILSTKFMDTFLGPFEVIKNHSDIVYSIRKIGIMNS